MASYHLGPNGISTGCFLPSRHSLVFHTPLDDATCSLKQRMLACHASQHAVLRYFRSDIEPIRIAPPYDFTVAPHPGLLFYEHMGWGITGAEWREHARVASRALGLRGRGEWLP